MGKYFVRFNKVDFGEAPSAAEIAEEDSPSIKGGLAQHQRPSKYVLYDDCVGQFRSRQYTCVALPLVNKTFDVTQVHVTRFTVHNYSNDLPALSLFGIHCVPRSTIGAFFLILPPVEIH